MKRMEMSIENIKEILTELEETLNPGMCRCFVDAFLTYKKHLEVRHLPPNSFFSSLVRSFLIRFLCFRTLTLTIATITRTTFFIVQ